MSTISQVHAGTGILSAIAVVAALAFAPSAGATDGVVGPANCNEGGFDSVLAAVDGSGGGTITFNCGTATIAFTGYKQIANAVTIDGGGRITLDGANATPLFQVFASAHATLKGLTLERGVYNGVHALENFGSLTLDHSRLTAPLRFGFTAAAGAQNFQLYRADGTCATANAGDFRLVGSANASPVVDDRTQGGFSYAYKVRGVQNDVEGAVSTCIDVVSDDDCTLAPAFDTNSLISGALQAVPLAWRPGSQLPVPTG